jgi:hypothetical protein
MSSVLISGAAPVVSLAPRDGYTVDRRAGPVAESRLVAQAGTNAHENIAAAYTGQASVVAHFGRKAEVSELARKAGSEAQAILSLHPNNPSARAIHNDAVRIKPDIPGGARQAGPELQSKRCL